MRKNLLIILIILPSIVLGGNRYWTAMDGKQKKVENRISNHNENLKFSNQLLEHVAEPTIKDRENSLQNIIQDIDKESDYSPFSFAADYDNPHMTRSEFMRDLEYHRLDSIKSLLFDGTNYTKEIFDYTNIYLDAKYVGSIWDPQAGVWDEILVYEYEWDENELIIVYSTANLWEGTGEKYEYLWDTERRVIRETILYKLINNQWVIKEKLTKDYDSNNNPIIQIAYLHDGAGWVENTRRESEWDEKNREIDFKVSFWDNNRWLPSYRATYAFDQWDNRVSYIYMDWDDSIEEWYYTHKYEHINIGFGIPILQEHLYWNRTLNDWVGQPGIPCTRTIWEYDERGRTTLEHFTKFINYTTWIDARSSETEITDFEDGSYNTLAKSYQYDSSGETRVHDTDFFKNVDHLGRTTFKKEVFLINGAWEPDYQEEYTYEGTNPEPILTLWWVKMNGVLVKDFLLDYTYDDEYNRIELMTYRNFGLGIDTELEPNFWYQYEWENGYKLRQYGWQHNGTNWVSRTGDGIDYDFTMPLTSLIIPIGYDFDYKVYYKYMFEPRAGSLEFNPTVYSYYYSEQTLPTSINPITNNLISIYPNPTQGLVHINSDDKVTVRVYNINGMLMTQTTEKQVDLTHFAPGMYIIDVNGFKAKVIRSR